MTVQKNKLRGHISVMVAVEAAKEKRISGCLLANNRDSVSEVKADGKENGKCL